MPKKEWVGKDSGTIGFRPRGGLIRPMDGFNNKNLILFTSMCTSAPENYI